MTKELSPKQTLAVRCPTYGAAPSMNVYGYDSYDKLAWTAGSGTPTCGTSGKCITYDAFGRMVEKSNNSAWTEIWYTQVPGSQITMSGTTAIYGYWPSPGRGTFVAGGTNMFLHQDWLGNDRIVSAVSGHTVSADRAYAPYGEQYNSFGSTNPIYGMFAGMTGDFDPGVLFDTPNRELAQYQGRWISPDPAGTGWNQYAYVNSNPLSYIDPSGLACYPIERLLTGGCGAFMNNGVNFGGDWNLLDLITGTTICKNGDCGRWIADGALDFALNVLGKWNKLNGELGITRPPNWLVKYCKSIGMTAGAEGCYQRAAMIWSGHGYFNPTDGYVTVPDGTSVTVWTGTGNKISGDFGVAIDIGSDLSPFAGEMTGAQTYLSGSQMPNYTLDAPTGLALLGNTNTVSGPTPLGSILQENMGNIQWSACCEILPIE